MTMTETRPEASAAPSTAAITVTDLRGPAGWITTSDHKRIGRLFIGASLLFLGGGLVVSGLLDLERVSSTDTQLLRLDSVGQLFSLAQIGLCFLFAVPMLLGIAICVVPLQVGARSLAFPRAAGAAFWGWLVGSGLLIASYAMNGGPGGGHAKGVDLFLLALMVVVISLLAAAVCVGATVLALRAPGMSLDRVPAFSWAALVTSVMLLASLPLLVANLLYLYVDHRYGRVAFGGNVGIASRIAWATALPQVYLYALPVLGVIADVLPTFARARQRMHQTLLGAIAVAGVLGFGAFAQQWLNPDVTHQGLFVVMAVGFVGPVIVVLGLNGVLLRTGRPRVGAPLICSLAAGLLFVVGAVAGALEPIRKLKLEGTAWETGHLDLIVVGAALLGALAALTYWGPKIWGRRLPDRAASGLAVLALLGSLLLAVPDLISGWVNEQPAGAVNFPDKTGASLLNALTFAGAALLVLVVVAFILLALRGFVTGEPAGDDPWGGQTLEWATASPPPPGNFARPIAEVTSPAPLLDRQVDAAADEEGR